MRALLTYSLHDYLRSHKYFPPVSTFLILIIVFYSYKPNPVIDSYAVTGLILYIISAWVSISVLSLDPPVQRKLLILRIGGENRYYLSKLISALLITMILTAIAFLYPIIFGMFGEPVTMTTGLVAIVTHLLLSVLGISLGSLFSKVITENAINAYGGLALMIVISIAALGISNLLPSYLKPIVWMIPPATVTQSPLISWSGDSMLELPLYPFLWMLIYSAFLVYLFLGLAKRVQK